MVQIMACNLIGHMPLPEPMVTHFTDAYMHHTASMKFLHFTDAYMHHTASMKFLHYLSDWASMS